MTSRYQRVGGWLAIAATGAMLPAVLPWPAMAGPTLLRGDRPLVAQAQAPTPPFPLNGKSVYVSRAGRWLEANLMGYSWDSNAGFRYTVHYLDDNRMEKGVRVDRILTLADAQQRGIATKVYEVSSQAGIEHMLNAHNTWRKRYGVPALTWSPQLAAYAQEWATKLVRENRFEHRSNSPYGENLAWLSGQQGTPERVVKMWGDEVVNYNAADNTCKPDQVCGHFTQVVWQQTRQVGCGMARSQNQEIWVCNYDPPGNVVGQKPF